MGGILLAFVLSLGSDRPLPSASNSAFANLPSSSAPSVPSDAALLALLASDPSAADGEAVERNMTTEVPVRHRANDEPDPDKRDRSPNVLAVVVMTAFFLAYLVWILISCYMSWRRFRMERDRHQLTMRHAQEQHEAKMAYSQELLRGIQRHNRREPWQEEP